MASNFAANSYGSTNDNRCRPAISDWEQSDTKPYFEARVYPDTTLGAIFSKHIGRNSFWNTEKLQISFETEFVVIIMPL